MSKRVKYNISLIFKILVGLLIIFPLVVTVILSFQSNGEIDSLPFNLFTKNPTLENYIFAVTNYDIPMLLRNTFIVILITIPTQILVSALCAYAVAHFDFPFKKALFAVILTVMMIPGETTIMSNYGTVQRMGLMDTFFGISIVSLVNVSGVFMLRQHMMTLPNELWEAAKVDGCGDMRYFVSVVLPLSKSIIAALTLTSFIGTYNSYFWPLLVTTKPERMTIPVGLAQIMIDANLYPGYVFAATAISMVVPLLIYIFGVDQIVAGMTAGALKS